MKRVVTLLGLLLLVAGTVHAQDVITYRDPVKKVPTPLNGVVLDENSNRVQVKPGFGANKDIPAVDVIDILYELKGQARFDYKRADNAEKNADKEANPGQRKKLLTDALKEYSALKDGVKDNKFAARHIEFKVAYLTAKLAGDDKAQIKAAADGLVAFKSKHGESWQILPCLRMLASLYTSQNDYEGAAKAFDDLLKVPGLSQETKTEAEMSAAQFLLQAKKHAEAEKRLTNILKSYAANDPKAEPIRMMLISCRAHTNFGQAIKDLEGMINAATDKRTVALAYNTLGDCYLLNNQPKEALYQYLWVDLIYNENAIEHRKACEQLAKLFGPTMLKRPERAKEYQEKLEKLK